MSNVKAVIEVPYLMGTPARANHVTGVIEISKAHFKNMPETYKQFVIEHEKGHLKLNTRNEFAADEYAMNKLLKKGYPLTEILQSLTRVLSHKDPQHYGRTLRLFNNLRNYDYFVNNNKKVLTHFKNKTMNLPDQSFDIYSEAFNPHSDFLGGLGGVLGNVLGAVTGGGGNNAAAQQAAQQNAALQAQMQAQQQQMQQMQMQQQMEAMRQANEPKESSNKEMYIIVAVVLVILVVAGVFMFRTKK